MKRSTSLAFALSAVVLLLPILAWGQSFEWDLASLSLYQLFPLFGLLAFSLFWLQLIAVCFRRTLENKDIQAGRFLKGSGIAFMLLVLMHPVFLDLALWLDGAVFSPQMALEYVSPRMRGYVYLGVFSLVVFIITEIAWRLSKVAIVKKLYKPLEYVNYVTFFFIFWHSIHLGSHLQEGSWLLGVWWFYAVSGAMFLVYYFLHPEQARGFSQSPRE